MTGSLLALGTVLAKDPPTGEASKSGPWGLAIILLLCLASYFLFKSMSRHMRKVREQFPTDRAGQRRRGGLAGRWTPPPAEPGPTAEPPDATSGETSREKPGETPPAPRPEPPGEGPRST